MFYKAIFATFLSLFLCHQALASEFKDRVFKAGHPSLQDWVLPEKPEAPSDNLASPERIELGKALFFDPRLSGDGNMSCASCHNPSLGWSDGLPTAKGFKSKVLGRASPTVINTGYNSIQMWDGRKKTLEDQAIGPLESHEEMNTDFSAALASIRGSSEYQKLFAKAYPGEEIDKTTIAKAIANFERTVISRNSRFDRWIQGDKKALTKEEIRGFKLFSNPEKGNCEVCHSAPNFTDNGFHNIGLASFADENPDLGRYAERPLGLMKGAFKTPTIRDITLTAPYFHDGSAETLDDVVDHYVKSGEVKTNLSPNLKELKLSEKEQKAIVAFMKSLTSDSDPVTLPQLPRI